MSCCGRRVLAVNSFKFAWTCLITVDLLGERIKNKARTLDSKFNPLDLEIFLPKENLHLCLQNLMELHTNKASA